MRGGKTEKETNKRTKKIKDRSKRRWIMSSLSRLLVA